MSTAYRAQTEDDWPTLGPDRLHGERNGWIYSEVADVKNEFRKARIQLLFLNKESGDVYTLSLVARMDPEKRAVRVFPHWLRFGDIDFCTPPLQLMQGFDDVISAFLAKLRLSGKWSLDPIPFGNRRP